jgi:ligand-binding sensor domain-containing protein
MNCSIPRLAAIVSCFILNISILSSQTHYLHFTIKEGLPSNKVYCAIQDASGFMWFGTDNGLVRYNGSEFKTFTVKDGLPDNDIYSVFEDAQNRLWVLGSKQAPCFFFRNKLYTTANDTVLAKYFNDVDMFRFTVNSHLKRILFYVVYKDRFAMLEYGTHPLLHIMPFKDARNYIKCPVMNLFSDKGTDYLVNTALFYRIGAGRDPAKVKSYLIHLEQVRFKGSYIGFYYHHVKKKVVAFKVIADSMQTIRTYDLQDCLEPCSNTRNELMFVRENGEVFTLDSSTLDLVKAPIPLITERVSTAAIDNSGNKWICTHDNGVFVYPKYSSIILSLKKGPTCLTWNDRDHELIAGFEDQSIFVHNGKASRNFMIPDKDGKRARITSLICKNADLYVGCDNKLVRFDLHTGQFYRYPDSKLRITTVIKDMEPCDDGRILIGSSEGAGFFSIDSGKITEPLWRIRTLAVCDAPGKGTFLGTINGLHWRQAGQADIKPYATGSNLDKARITDIKYDRFGRIWVGTAQFGVFIIDGKKVINLNDNKSSPSFITSYYVRCIFIDEAGIAWIGTDKGINRIRYFSQADCRIDRIVASFGIPNDNISALHVRGDTIYMASLDGISSFNYRSTILKEVPGLEITGMFMNGARLPNINGNIFHYSDNNISIEYSAIAFRSAKNIEFNYRLVNSGTEWIKTVSNRVDLPDMNPGQHRFEIKAINTISGEESPVKYLEFKIKTPWYQSIYFISGIIIICIVLTWWIIGRRIKSIRKQSQENNRINKQFAELEMQALRAQMNPHFIFNAMSAIQNYFVNNDEEKANAYMSKFARLIRQMLDYSKDNFIALDEEISLLTNYMLLEKMRFEKKLDFQLHIDDKIEISEYILPSLLLQPILENAVNHGVRPLKTLGTIWLNISLDPHYLVCEIRDDGIGIKQSKSNKTSSSMHQSKGMEILNKRIESINHLYNTDVRIDITDISDILPPLTGTIIVIRFPLSLVTKTMINHI